MKENEELREAKEKLDTLSADKRMQRIAELRQKAIMDEKATYRLGEKRGIEQGKNEAKIEYEKKMIKEKREIAKKMLNQNVELEIIITCTGLSVEELEQLKNEL